MKYVLQYLLFIVLSFFKGSNTCEEMEEEEEEQGCTLRCSTVQCCRCVSECVCVGVKKEEKGWEDREGEYLIRGP